MLKRLNSVCTLLSVVFYFIAIVAMLVSGCSADRPASGPQTMATDPGSVAYAERFLADYDTALAVLSNEAGQVIVSPRYQGKVFTSGIGGDTAVSRGWINFAEIARDSVTEHMNAYGGENRFWLGPEGGQYSVFFAPGSDFSFANWQTPAAIDSEAWSVTERGPTAISLEKEAKLVNHSGTVLDLRMDRTVDLLSPAATRELLPAEAGEYPAVAYRTTNRVTNTGAQAWTAEGGAVSIWMLDMFAPGENTVVILPYRQDGTGDIVRSDYFGRVPEERLQAEEGVVLYRTDGKQRGKIGIPPQRATDLAGSVDLSSGHVTLVRYDIDPSARYPRQEWKLHEEPYTGDAVNAYNDGPLEDGSQMGPFYEIESVSPAAFLQPGESLDHRHTVIHLNVPPAELERAIPALFGTELRNLQNFLQP